MSSAQLMHSIATYTGFFLIMIVFMIVAIINAKKKTAWIWYSIGSILQLLSLLGKQKSASYYGYNTTVDWIIYFGLLIASATLIVNKYNKALLHQNTNSNSNSTCDKQFGWKWFIFYTKIRPWIACLSFITLAVDFSNYTYIYIGNFWLMLYLLGAVAQVVLCVIVFLKSSGDYATFVRFVHGVLFFETINITYQQGIQQYIQNGFDFLHALIMFIVILPIAYFLWYKLNIKYFKKRILGKTKNPEPYKSRFSECPKCGYIALSQLEQCPKCGFTHSTEVQEANNPVGPRILYCRKCGSKLPEDSNFCQECGTEIVTKVEETPNAL